MNRSSLAIVFISTCAILGCKEGPPVSKYVEADIGEFDDCDVIDFSYPDTKIVVKLKDAPFRDFLVRYLASSSDWRVHTDHALVADLRNTSRTEDLSLGVRVRFGPYNHMTSTRKEVIQKAYYTLLPIGSPGSVKMTRFRRVWLGDGNRPISSTMVGKKDVGAYIEIWEESNDMKRTATRKALDDILSTIARVHESWVEPDTATSWLKHFPDLPVTGKPSLIISEGHYSSRVITGYVNPGEPGYIVVRAFDAQNNQELQPIDAMLRRQQYVGWSQDPAVQFPFECTYSPSDSPLAQKRNVRFEVQFYPEQGRQLLTATEPNIPVLTLKQD